MPSRRRLNAVRHAALVAILALTACAGTAELKPSSATSHGAAGWIILSPTRDFVPPVTTKVLFRFDSAVLDRAAQSALDGQATFMRVYWEVRLIQIAGHCDDRGTEEYNLALGARRANAARDYFIAKGVAPSRIRVISYGKDRPIAAGDTEQARAQNRVAVTSGP